MFQTQIPKRKSKKQQAAEANQVAVVQEKKKKKGLFSFFRGATESLLQDLKSTLIQIFQRPSNDEINKAILRELKKIRAQLRSSPKRGCVHENVEAPLESDSDSEPETLQITNTETRENKSDMTIVSIPPKPAAEHEEEFDVINEDPNNPVWLRDPELGDGEVSITVT